MRQVVGTVGDRAHHGKGNAKIVADLRQRRPFHLDGERIGQPLIAARPLRSPLRDETVAADNHASVDPWPDDAERA